MQESGLEQICRAASATLGARPSERLAMAHLSRYFLPDQPRHLIQRANNRQAIFFAPEDYARYRAWLAKVAAEHGCAVHAYVLMTNHVHLLPTPTRRECADALGRRVSPLPRGRKPKAPPDKRRAISL